MIKKIPLCFCLDDEENMYIYGNIYPINNSIADLTNRLMLSVKRNEQLTNDLDANSINSVSNCVDLWKYILKLSERNEPISIDLISEFNYRTLSWISCNAGNLRDFDNPISITNATWVPPIPIYENTIDTINDILNMVVDDKVEIAVELYTYLIKYQLFKNGNKRTAYFVTNYYCICNNIGLLNFNNENYKDYLYEQYKLFNYGSEEDFKKFLINNCIIRL